MQEHSGFPVLEVQVVMIADHLIKIYKSNLLYTNESARSYTSSKLTITHMKWKLSYLIYNVFHFSLNDIITQKDWMVQANSLH